MDPGHPLVLEVEHQGLRIGREILDHLLHRASRSDPVSHLIQDDHRHLWVLEILENQKDLVGLSCLDFLAVQAVPACPGHPYLLVHLVHRKFPETLVLPLVLEALGFQECH